MTRCSTALLNLVSSNYWSAGIAALSLLLLSCGALANTVSLSWSEDRKVLSQLKDNLSYQSEELGNLLLSRKQCLLPVNSRYNHALSLGNRGIYLGRAGALAYFNVNNIRKDGRARGGKQPFNYIDLSVVPYLQMEQGWAEVRPGNYLKKDGSLAFDRYYMACEHFVFGKGEPRFYFRIHLETESSYKTAQLYQFLNSKIKRTDNGVLSIASNIAYQLSTFGDLNYTALNKGKFEFLEGFPHPVIITSPHLDRYLLDSRQRGYGPRFELQQNSKDRNRAFRYLWKPAKKIESKTITIKAKPATNTPSAGVPVNQQKKYEHSESSPKLQWGKDSAVINQLDAKRASYNAEQLGLLPISFDNCRSLKKRDDSKKLTLKRADRRINSVGAVIYPNARNIRVNGGKESKQGTYEYIDITVIPHQELDEGWLEVRPGDYRDGKKQRFVSYYPSCELNKFGYGEPRHYFRIELQGTNQQETAKLYDFLVKKIENNDNGVLKVASGIKHSTGVFGELNKDILFGATFEFLDGFPSQVIISSIHLKRYLSEARRGIVHDRIITEYNKGTLLPVFRYVWKPANMLPNLSKKLPLSAVDDIPEQSANTPKNTTGDLPYQEVPQAGSPNGPKDNERQVIKQGVSETTLPKTPSRYPMAIDTRKFDLSVGGYPYLFVFPTKKQCENALLVPVSNKYGKLVKYMIGEPGSLELTHVEVEEGSWGFVTRRKTKLTKCFKGEKLNFAGEDILLFAPR